MCVAHTCKIALTQTSTSTTVQRWAWHPGFFLFFFHSRLDINQYQDGWSVGASRINHTTSGHSQSMPTRLDWLKLQNKEQCSKSKKEPEVLVATMQPNTKGTEPTFSNPSFFFKKRNGCSYPTGENDSVSYHLH